MLKNSILTSVMAMLLVASLGTSPVAAKTKKQSENQPPAALNDLQAPQSGRYDSSAANSSSDGQSMSLFKAGNTTLPAGTYAMTNVSTGAAFVVIVDDSGDMRAQDARAMNLVGDSHSKHSRSKRGSYSSNSSQPYNDGNRDYNSAAGGGPSNYDGGSGSSYGGNSAYSGASGSSGTSNSSGASSSSGGSTSGIPTSLPPQPTPASAILPAPTGGHPLLQGVNQMTAPSQSSLGSVLPGLFNQSGLGAGQQNLPGQLPGGIKGALQQELQRQIMKRAPQIERQVRKYIK
ncbi:MAG: hypothetical protein IT343_13370 [Candidatus Melainabacteria bacterium]|nr:hypothetical protein [Candidatus Melainabacteria bacterium]